MERYWYTPTKHWLMVLLLPLAWLFQAVVSLRKKLYQLEIKKSVHFSMPIVVVGNITVGGTGKTPLVIFLAKLLQEEGYRPGIVSRGVGGRLSRLPRFINADANPTDVGDEAVLLAEKSSCPVVIGIDRVVAVQALLAAHQCDVILSDDGLQHYRLGRDIEIAVVDGARGLGNRCFLPAGPLREAPNRLEEVDFIIEQVTDGGSHATYLPMQLRGNELVAVLNPKKNLSITSLQKTKVHAVAAIGNPQRFFALLRRQGLELIEHIFLDHYLYKENDFQFNDDLPIVMTEKDAVKCRRFADERFWYLPVEPVISEEFKHNFLSLLQEKRQLHTLKK